MSVGQGEHFAHRLVLWKRRSAAPKARAVRVMPGLASSMLLVAKRRHLSLQPVLTAADTPREHDGAGGF